MGFRSWLKQITSYPLPPPPASLATLAEGTPGLITGTIEATGGSLLAAPLTGLPCVYWAIDVGEFEGGLTPAPYRGLGTAHDVIPFLLRDDDGHRALVEPRNVRIFVLARRHQESAAVFDATKEQRELLQRFGLLERNWFNTSRMKYHEAILVPGDRITLAGAGTRETDLDAASRLAGLYRDAPPTRMRFTGGPTQQLIIRKVED